MCEGNTLSQRSRVQPARTAPLQCRRLLPRDTYNLRVLWFLFSRPYVPNFPWRHHHECVTLAERYERTMSCLDQITRPGYLVKVNWECDFDDAGSPEMLELPIVKQSPLRTRDALYGGRTEAKRLHYKVRENGTIQYVDVMSLYLYICKYVKFLVGHPIIRVRNASKDIEACLRMDGRMKYWIFPPERLYLTVLP